MPDPKGKLVTPVGFRTDGTIHSLLLDLSDRLSVVIDTASQVLSYQYGFINAGWHKNPITKGIYSNFIDNTGVQSIGGVSTQVTGTTVPSGHAYILKLVTVQQNDTVARPISIYAHNAVVNSFVQIYNNLSANPGQAYPVSPLDMTLLTGDYVYAVCTSLANTKFVYINIWYDDLRIDL